MADIELVIKIPEETYDFCKKIAWRYRPLSIEYIIAHGIPLPKGHGRLIDADEIQFENADFDTYGDYCIAFDAIDQSDTIIEADKTERSEE